MEALEQVPAGRLPATEIVLSSPVGMSEMLPNLISALAVPTSQGRVRPLSAPKLQDNPQAQAVSWQGP